MKNNFTALVHSADACWGFNVGRDKGQLFTVDLARELLAFANEEYPKRFPDRERTEFNYVELNMSDYDEETVFTATGDEARRIIGDKKVGKYWANKNLLRIVVNGTPIYENDNGKICRDPVAIADSL